MVIEGRLQGFESSELASKRELKMTFPGKTGEVLDLRELEQTNAEQLFFQRRQIGDFADTPVC